jgi:hypothetical protein
MKIKLKIPMIIDGKEISEGEIVNINENNLDKWLKKGWGSVIEKELKPKKKETKELKVAKETKNETNQD